MDCIINDKDDLPLGVSVVYQFGQFFLCRVVLGKVRAIVKLEVHAGSRVLDLKDCHVD